MSTPQMSVIRTHLEEVALEPSWSYRWNSIDDRMKAIAQLYAHAENPHLTRARRLEAAMDAQVASGDREGAAASRDLMQAALWDWYQDVKRGEK